ncbi:hypothetical protein CHS0354_042329 [Potamilus streckersoni]|uniref:Apextrin C-terminal domain-containing protein n=1 Tax=Potamilus streckersoni TaxID=2493646 RepID=A0AAE0W2E9_9BIVA|nr:hypothetical protein CHS0354_042329 [Potamilus streckersoni]
MGYSASLGVNFENFKDSNSYKISFGTHQYTLISGSENLPEPIGLRVVSIDEALVEKYWWNSHRFVSGGQCHSDVKQHLGTLRLNFIQALSEYAAYMMAPQATDPPLKIPVTWPAGSYGLLKPKTGCPLEQNFHWYEGWRHQDSEDMTIYGNKFSDPLNMYGQHDSGSVTQWFCIKGQRTVSDFDIDWPQGDYCIMKYGTCPVGFSEGYIKWDDDDPFNDDAKEGVLPDGMYDNGNTLIEYCCRNDGLPTEPIVLPSDRPFYLFQYTRGCQIISGMNIAEEFVDFNTEDLFNKDEVHGAHPYDDGESTRHRLHLCYYEHPLPASIVG